MSLKKKILITMVCIVFSVSLFLGLVTFQQAEGVVNNFEKKIVVLNAQNSVVLVQDVFENVRNLLVKMVDNTDLYALAEAASQDAQATAQQEQALTDSVRAFLSDSSVYGDTSLTFVNIYLENGINALTTEQNLLPFSDFVSVCDYLEQEDILAKDEYKAIVWLDTVRTRDVDTVDTDCFVCVRFLYDRVTMRRIGAIVAGTNTEDISNVFHSVFPEALILNEKGNVIIGDISNDEQAQLSVALKEMPVNRKGDESHIVYSVNNIQRQALYWRIANNCAYFVIPLSDGNSLQSEVARSFLVNLVITILIAVFVAGTVSVLSAKVLTNGLVKLTKVVQKIAGGAREERFVPKKHDEVAYLGVQFNQMLDELQNHYEKVQRYQEEKQALELSLLQSKINPHLLYNTLDIAVWAIKNNDASKAVELIYALSKFFKHTLAKGRQFITLENEIGLIQSYIKLQCLAGNKSYTVVTEIDPSLREYQIPHLLLQPIVENSVLHGFRDFVDDGQILISAAIEDNGCMLVLRVRDNGIGITPDKIMEINSIAQEDMSREAPKSYGLMNISRRIKNYYGNQFGMSVSSEVGEYTETLIRLPFVDRTKLGE